jgi:hypothetical protein
VIPAYPTAFMCFPQVCPSCSNRPHGLRRLCAPGFAVQPIISPLAYKHESWQLQNLRATRPRATPPVRVISQLSNGPLVFTLCTVIVPRQAGCLLPCQFSQHAYTCNRSLKQRLALSRFAPSRSSVRVFHRRRRRIHLSTYLPINAIARAEQLFITRRKRMIAHRSRRPRERLAITSNPL